MKGQTGKIVLVIVLLAAAGGVYWSYGRERPLLPGRVEFFCVETGDFFSIPRNQALGMPLKNPNTGKNTLVPVFKEEDGTFKIPPRYGTLLSELKDVNKHADPKTLICKPAG